MNARKWTETGKQSSSGVNAILSQPEVANDVISGQDANLWVAGLSSFQENQNQLFMECIDDGKSTWASFSGSRSKNV